MSAMRLTVCDPAPPALQDPYLGIPRKEKQEPAIGVFDALEIHGRVDDRVGPGDERRSFTSPTRSSPKTHMLFHLYGLIAMIWFAIGPLLMIAFTILRPEAT